MEKQQAAASVGKLREAEQSGETVATLAFLLSRQGNYPLWRSHKPSPAISSCAKLNRSRKVLPFWAFCCVALVPMNGGAAGHSQRWRTARG